MPLRDYVCEGCGCVQERLDRGGVLVCGECGVVLSKTKVSRANVIYLGPGFFTTENRNVVYKDGIPGIGEGCGR